MLSLVADGVLEIVPGGGVCAEASHVVKIAVKKNAGVFIIKSCCANDSLVKEPRTSNTRNAIFSNGVLSAFLNGAANGNAEFFTAVWSKTTFSLREDAKRETRRELRELVLSCRKLHRGGAETLSGNPEGVKDSSPGLRGTSSPGFRFPKKSAALKGRNSFDRRFAEFVNVKTRCDYANCPQSRNVSGDNTPI